LKLLLLLQVLKVLLLFLCDILLLVCFQEHLQVDRAVDHVELLDAYVAQDSIWSYNVLSLSLCHQVLSIDSSLFLFFCLIVYILQLVISCILLLLLQTLDHFIVRHVILSIYDLLRLLNQ
jgi:hypothetical protein